MPFKQTFERTVNSNMQDDNNEDHDMDKTDIEKDLEASSSRSRSSEDDYELSSKKDAPPPRFSTLFEGSPTPVVIESQTPPKRKSGVHLPKSVFAILIIVLLLESTFLFAYTVIGLYNNLPSHFLSVTGLGPAPIDSGGCSCGDRQPAINIAPNFIMPGANQPVDPFLTGGAKVPPAEGSSSMEAAAASDVMSVIRSMLPTTTSSNTKVLTVTPTSVPVVTHTNVVTSTPSAATSTTTVNN